jgi:hypothetical protein
MFAFAKVELFIAVGHIIPLGAALGKAVPSNKPMRTRPVFRLATGNALVTVKATEL